MGAESQQTVLLTGASGFVGGHILQQLLAKGYHVRNVVRSANNIDRIKLAHPHHASQLSFVTVPDMAAPHAFDRAVQGVSGIIHCASPFVFDVEDKERDILKPAIDGALNVLRTAATEKSVTRVILTSSFAAVFDYDLGYRPGYTYTTDDWNPATYEQAASHSSGAWTYCASKGLMEKAAWEYMQTAKPSFSLSTICPPWIIGPSVNPITSLTNLNASTKIIYDLINGSLTEVPPTDFCGFADVRDVAAAHVGAYETPAAAGERFIVAGGPWSYQTAVDIIREEFPELAAAGKVPVGTPGAGEKEDVYRLDVSKAVKVLGLKLRSMREAVCDCVKQLLEVEKQLEQQQK
jgi:NADPH-dependent methylglyoxal reductase